MFSKYHYKRKHYLHQPTINARHVDASIVPLDHLAARNDGKGLVMKMLDFDNRLTILSNKVDNLSVQLSHVLKRLDQLSSSEEAKLGKRMAFEDKESKSSDSTTRLAR